MKNLADLQPGDCVLVRARHRPDEIRKVSRVTKTRVIIKANDFCENSYNKESGRSIGSTRWSRSYIHIPTDEQFKRLIFDMKRRNLLRKIEECKMEGFSLETLEAINALIEKEEAERKAKAEGGR